MVKITYPRKIWVLRHAEREDNVNRNWKKLPNAVGLQRDNPPLSGRGKKQAKECAARFANLEVAHIVASPYDRTTETASIVAAEKGLKVKPEGGLCEALYLCEWPPGIWETDKLQEKYPLVDSEYVPVYAKNDLPKEYGEDDCVPRVRKTMEKIFAELYGNIILVSHGSPIGAIHEVLNGYYKYVGQATVSEFTEIGPNQFQHEYSADPSHLSNKKDLRG